MERIQLQATGIVTGTNNQACKHLIILETGWVKLSKRRGYHRLVLFYKIVRGTTPQHIYNTFLNHTNFLQTL